MSAREELIKEINEAVSSKSEGAFYGTTFSDEEVRIIHYLVGAAYYNGQTQAFKDAVEQFAEKVEAFFIQKERRHERSDTH